MEPLISMGDFACVDPSKDKLEVEFKPHDIAVKGQTIIFKKLWAWL